MIFSATLQTFPNVIHGFTTRKGAHDKPLDLGSHATLANWAHVAQRLGVPGYGVALVSQVHGAAVVWASEPGHVGEADAVITDTPGLLIAVRTADCVPILVVGQEVVGAIHAGWRGLAAGVIPAAIEQMRDRGSLSAVVGPSICQDCYEVGEEVVDGIARWVEPEAFVDRSRKKPHVDVAAAAVAQLRANGVKAVERLSECTWCDDALWSHRQQGSAAGRNAAVIGIRC